jgi:hypothetical protein
MNILSATNPVDQHYLEVDAEYKYKNKYCKIVFKHLPSVLDFPNIRANIMSKNDCI